MKRGSFYIVKGAVSGILHSRTLWLFQGLRPWGRPGFAWRRPPFRSCEKEAKAKGCAFGTYFPDPISFVLPKETVSDRQRKALSGPPMRPSMDRRTKTRHTLPPAPLPLMPTKASLFALLDRAPNADICLQQACPEDLAEFNNCQWSGSGK